MTTIKLDIDAIRKRAIACNDFGVGNCANDVLTLLAEIKLHQFVGNNLRDERDRLVIENDKLTAVAEAALEICRDLNGRKIPPYKHHVVNLNDTLANLNTKETK